jgi:DNA-directed RNA polymerase subunit F
MSTLNKVKAENIKFLSNPETLQYIEKYIERVKEESATTPSLALKVQEYLRKFSHIPSDRANELRSKLEELGLKEESIVMIMNICPGSIDELVAILQVEEKTFERGLLETIINTIRDYCTES